MILRCLHDISDEHRQTITAKQTYATTSAGKNRLGREKNLQATHLPLPQASTEVLQPRHPEVAKLTRETPIRVLS